jgi:predicted RND superfamily exporter protein
MSTPSPDDAPGPGEASGPSRVQRRYEALVARGWWAILLGLAVAAVLLGRHAPDLEVEAGTSSLLNEGDADLAYYDASRTSWGSDEYAIVCASGRDWVSAEGAKELRALVADLAALPAAASVVSLLDVPLLRQADGITFDLGKLRTLKDDDVDFARAKVELLGHEIAVGNVISADGRATSVLVYLKGAPGTAAAAPGAASAAPGPSDDASQDARHDALVAGVRRVAATWGARLGEPVRLSGICVINVNLVEHLRHDLRVFGIAALGFFLLTFLAIYRRWMFVVLPILVSALPVVLIVGAMAAAGMTITIITSSLPLLLFVLLLPYTVYFVEAYQERQLLAPQEPGTVTSVKAATAIFLPCLLSCTTTMAGFAALRTSLTRPVRDFGVMLAIGMAVGLVVVFLAVPSISRPFRKPRPPHDRGRGNPYGVVRVLANLSLRHPWAVVVGAAVILAVSLAGASRLSAQSKFTSYFQTESEVYKGLEYVDTQMGGTTPLEVHLKAPSKGFFLTPKGIAATAAVGAYFDGVPETGNVRSMARLVRELEKKNPKVVTALPVLVKVPAVRAVTADVLSADGDVALVVVRMRETAPTLDRAKILAGLRAHLASRPELAGIETRVTGVFLLYQNMLDTLIETQNSSFYWVVAAVFVMVLLLFRALVVSTIVVVTQVLPTMVTLGTMGWAGIPLDLVTVMIASISMGVGIDASIQYAWRHRLEQRGTPDPAEAVRRTHATVGRAIWIATTVIVCGFLVLVLSDFRPSVWLGVLNAVAMIVSQLSALTVLPALLYLRERRRARRASGPTG